MKKVLALILCIICIFSTIGVSADEGELGPFGGISEGTTLPTNIEYSSTTNKKPTTTAAAYNNYEEYIFINGTPTLVKGTMSLSRNDSKARLVGSGTYTERYTMKATSEDGETVLDRDFTALVEYVNDGKQIIRTAKKSSWKETITIAGTAYTLNAVESEYYKTSTEDLTPGVSYYNTVSTFKQVYYNNGASITVTGDGDIYGYRQPWSKTEAQKLELHIDNKIGTPWQIDVVIRPCLNAFKSVYFKSNTPNEISFSGTYMQRLEKEGTLRYEITTENKGMTEEQKKGYIAINPVIQPETLGVVPEGLDFLEGHWAEGDVKQLYCLGIMTNIPSKNMLYQLTTRGEFIKMLTLALKLDVDSYDDKDNEVFRDVPYGSPYFKYVAAAYITGISVGVGEDNLFGIDRPITRQEAFTLLIRTIGLKRIPVGESPKTQFIDDLEIADWARREIAAAYMVGIVKGDDQNKVNPKAYIRDTESAAIVNRMLAYLREEISVDYKNFE